MNTNPHNAMDYGEETLRLIAGLPAPAGVEERVHAALRAAPDKARDKGHVLAWPARWRAKAVLESDWMRAAAAAAIVFVVVGGGWGVYTRVQQGQTGSVVVMPLRAPSSGGFAGAGAMRTPSTLPGTKSREQGSKGARERETQPVKMPAAPKKHSAQPANQVAPTPVVSQ